MAPAPSPDAIAMYCLPLTSNVIGGAEKPEPTLIFHSSSRGRVVISRDGAVQKRQEDDATARHERAAEIRVAQMDVIFDLTGKGVDDGQIAFVAFRCPVAAA